MKKSGMRNAAFCLTGMLALCVATGAQRGDIREQREVARGVRYTHLERMTPAGEPWSIHVVEVSRGDKKIAVRSVQAAGDENGMKRELPTAMAYRAQNSGLNVVAVVNGDYDLPAPHLGVSDGLSITDGFVTTTGKPTWPAMAVTSSGEPLIGVPQVEMILESHGRRWPIASLNKPLGTTWGTGLHLYTREFRQSLTSTQSFASVRIGSLTHLPPLKADGTLRGRVEAVFTGTNEVVIGANRLVLAEPLSTNGPSSVLGLFRDGDKVKLRIRVRMNGKKEIRDVVGGFPILVEGGRKHIVGEPKASFAQRNPRTAVCYNARKFIFVVVDGRQPKLSVGMTLDELADLMVELGCASAMNTDGGGSSVMAVAMDAKMYQAAIAKDHILGAGLMPLAIVNSPSDGQERGRGNAWIVVQKK